MTDEILIPFPPEDYPCRDGKEIKTWMDGYEAALNDVREAKGNKISLSPMLCSSLPADDEIHNHSLEWSKDRGIIADCDDSTMRHIGFKAGALWMKEKAAGNGA